MSFYDRLKRYARKQNAVVTNDPDGVLACLQITKRLFAESLQTSQPDERPLTLVQALDRAIPLAKPKDPVRARHYCLRVLIRHVGLHTSPLAVITDAISAQAKTNKFQARGPQA